MSENYQSKNWWLVLLRGICAILFSFLAFTQSGITLAVLLVSFATFTLLEGVLGTAAAIRVRKLEDDWWVLLLEGVLAIAIALITFTSPLLTTLALLFYIATWAIITGALRILIAIRLRHEIKGEFWMISGGLVSIAFGVLMMKFPGAGALALLSFIGFWALVTGTSLVLLSFRMRQVAKELEGAPGQTHERAHAH